MLFRSAGGDLDGNGEALPCAVADARAELGAPETAPLGKQRQGFEQVGLAAPVLAGDDDRFRVDREVEMRVGAEILENDPFDPVQRRADQRGSAMASWGSERSRAMSPVVAPEGGGGNGAADSTAAMAAASTVAKPLLC